MTRLPRLALLTIAALGSIVHVVGPAQAVPGVGDSDGDNRFDITTCDELFTELSGASEDFEINPPGGSIDCGGTSRSPISGFTGDLYGNGATISGVVISCTGNVSCGLFDTFTRGSTIDNITLSAPQVSSTATGAGYATGILAGRTSVNAAYSVTVSNISIDGGTVSSSGSYVGSILGWAYYGVFSYLASDATVVGAGVNVGGLLGALDGAGCSNGSPSLTNSNFGGTVDGGRSVGGIVGNLYTGLSGGCNVTNVINTGDVTARGTDTDACEVGGVAGRIVDSRVMLASNSGDVIVPAGGRCIDQVGGLIGASYGGSGRSTIDRTWNEGSVGVAGTNHAKAHGLVGFCEGAEITRSYNTGAVHGWWASSGFAMMGRTCPSSDAFARADVQGAAGFGGATNDAHPRTYSAVVGLPYSRYAATGGSCTGSFWDSTISAGTNQCTGALGKTTTEMKTEATFTDAGWDFSCIDPVWAIDATINDGYPFLVGVGMGDGYTSTEEPVTIQRSGSGTLTSGQSDTITFTLCEPSSTFSDSNITVSGGSLSNFSGTVTTYSATFTPDPDSAGTASISVAAGTFTDDDGNPAGASTALTIPFNTSSAPSSLSYASNSLTLPANVAMTTLTPTVTGTVTSWTVSPTLPTGLIIDPSTGVISGTPTTAAAAATYTITASNSAGSDTFAITIEVVSPPSSLSFTSSTVALTSGRAMTALTPTVTGTVTSWTVSPALPTGLSLNSATGVISGTPATATASATYTVTATNSAGSDTFDITITVTAPVAGDTTPPVVFLYRDIHILAAGETNTITFAIPEQVTGFTIDDITVTAGTLSNFQSLDSFLFNPQDDVYAVTYTPPVNSSGTATMSIAAGRFTDLAGNANLASLPMRLEYNTVPREPVTDSSGEQTRVTGGAGLVIEDDGETTRIPVVEADSKATLTDGVSTMAITLNERVRLNAGRVEAPTRETVEVTGSGFEPDTDVEVWVFSEPHLLGTVLVDGNGDFSAELDLPATLPVGNHTIQAEGRVNGGGLKALAVGLTIESQNVFVELTPARVVDTRSGGRIGALDGSGDALEVQITGDDVPDIASAVALNVTVVDGIANDFGGYVTVYPCGTRPDASNLNFISGQTVPNSVIAPLSDDGTICLYVYGTAHLLVDISGYFESGFEPLTPTRLTDTRSSDRVGAINGSGDALEVQVAGDLVPADASAVALNVTVVDGQAGDYGGYVTVYPCGTRPDASNLNFISGQTVPNSVIAPLSDDGTICLYVYGTAHLLVDISGYLTIGFESMRPERLVDTRSSDRVGAIDGSGDALEVQIVGDVVPDTANAVALNVTVVDGAAGDFGGYVTVYPCGTRPDASNLNFTSGQTVPNSVIAPLSDDGTICLYVYGTAHLLVDISGYLLNELRAA